MLSAKDIHILPISAADANKIVRRIHYSGKVVPNSQLHFGVFLNGKIEGALQFGPSMVKKNIIGLVKHTGWNEFLELNRMALSDKLPRNSESRAIGFCLRFIKKNYPHIKWVITFADGTQCGDGTIYRACGFKLIGIKKNTGLRINPITGETQHQITAYHNIDKSFKDWKKLDGFQLKYIYFLANGLELTVPEIPYAEIKAQGARMYLGERKQQEIGHHPILAGVVPSRSLH